MNIRPATTMNLHAKSQLLERLSTAVHAPGYRSTIETVFALGSMIDSARHRAADDLNLSDAGRAAHVAKAAIDNVKPLIQATASARKATRWNDARRATLKPPAMVHDDQVAEM